MVAEGWTWEEEKAFEDAVAVHCETGSDWLEKVAPDLPAKTLEEIKNHYEVLVEDVASIEAGRVPLPSYASSSSSSSVANVEDSADGGGHGKKGGSSHGDAAKRGKGSLIELERRKGIAWSEEEHRLFLLGLEKYGKGDWRSISRNFVISRTPTQVASHAQKYFIRQNSMNKDRRRSSIHDITRVNDGDAGRPSQRQQAASSHSTCSCNWHVWCHHLAACWWSSRAGGRYSGRRATHGLRAPASCRPRSCRPRRSGELFADGLPDPQCVFSEMKLVGGSLGVKIL